MIDFFIYKKGQIKNTSFLLRKSLQKMSTLSKASKYSSYKLYNTNIPSIIFFLEEIFI